MEKIFSNRWFHAVAFFLLAASVILVYSNTFDASFQFDDQMQIVRNQTLADIGNLPELLRHNRGISTATLALNYYFFGLDVFSWHVVNVSIHLLNALVAYLLVFRIFRHVKNDATWARKYAFFTALIFAVHPAQTQTVTYIIQRMESMAALFYMLGALFFVMALETEAIGKRMKLYVLVIISYAAGFYSKEIAITLPVVIFLYDLYFSGRGLKGMLGRWPLYGALAALMVFFAISTIMPFGWLRGVIGHSAKAGITLSSTHVAEKIHVALVSVKGSVLDTPPAYAGEDGGASVNNPVRDISKEPVPEGPSAGFSLKNISAKEYLYTQFNVIVYYTALLAAPVNQNLDYDFPVARSLFEAPSVNKGAVLNIPMPPPIISLAIIVAILAVSFYLYKRSASDKPPVGRIISFFILWFFIILLPTSSFIPINDVIYEHRVYLPSLGFFAVFVLCVERIFSRLFNGNRAKGGVLNGA